MKKLLLILSALVAFTFAASANNYEISDSSIDALFSEAEMVAPAAEGRLDSMSATNKTLVAFILDTVGLGTLGIHRLILGTNPVNIVLYIVTLGGIFGIIPFIDWIMLLLDIVDGSANYINNPAFIMWL